MKKFSVMHIVLIVAVILAVLLAYNATKSKKPEDIDALNTENVVNTSNQDGGLITYGKDFVSFEKDDSRKVKFKIPEGWKMVKAEHDSHPAYLISTIDSGLMEGAMPEKVYYEIWFDIAEDMSFYNDAPNKGGFREGTLTLSNGMEVKTFVSTTVPSINGQYTYFIQIPGDTKLFGLTLSPFVSEELINNATQDINPLLDQDEALKIFNEVLLSIEFK